MMRVCTRDWDIVPVVAPRTACRLDCYGMRSSCCESMNLVAIARGDCATLEQRDGTQVLDDHDARPSVASQGRLRIRAAATTASVCLPIFAIEVSAATTAVTASIAAAP
eukprot:6682528-Pyramimonas_sp.AAC.2